MSLNASGFWVSQPSPISYGDYYTYKIINASDAFGNKVASEEEKEKFFTIDKIDPDVVNWEYFNSEGINGTFKANVSDSWGIIDTVIVNVTYHEVLGSLNTAWAVMVNTTSGYMNDTIDLQRGNINFTIRVNDTGRNVYISPEHTGYIQNTPPLVENLTLSSDPSSEVLPVTSNSTLYILYDYFDIEGDLEAGTERKWYRWETNHWEFKLTEANLTSSWLVKGDIWRATVKPQDDGGDFGEIVTSANITIQNSAPVATNIIISPENPKTDNILIAYYDWVDADSSDSQQIPKTVNGTIIQWYRNREGAGFTLLSGYTNETQIPTSETFKDDIFYCNITPSDGYSYGNQFKSSEITIQNTLPDLTIYVLNNTEWITSPVTINDTTDLEVNNTNFDADFDTLTGLEISWFKYNFVLSKFEWKVNDTKILKSGNTTDDDIWIVKMRIYDGTFYSEWFSSSSIRIGTALIPNQLPTAFSINLTSSYNVTGGFLYANYTFSDPDGDDEGLFTQFKWYKWDSSSSIWVHQSQFSELTYNLTTAQLIKGDSWKVSVRPQDNNTDYGPWSINSTEFKIGNSAPFVVSAEIIPTSNVYTTDTLLANWLGDDINNDLIINYSIVWINGTIEVSSLFNETEVPSSYTRREQIWKFKIKLWDGEAWSTNLTSAPIDILNSVPRLENVTLSGGSDTLIDITITYDWVDLDGDTIDNLQSKINWTVERDGQVVSLINGTWTLDNTNFVAGDYVTIQITPHDGVELGVIWEAFRVRKTIGNAKPMIDGTPNILDPDDGTLFYASNQLFANYSASDPDFGESDPIFDIEIDGNGLVVGAEYQWFREGELISELTNSFVPISYLHRGDIWNFKVRPRDRRLDFGDWVNSSEITIINSPPVITDFYAVNLNTKSDMDLELYFVYFDFDHDMVNLSKTLILWYNFTQMIPETENSTVISYTKFGNEYHVRICLNNTFYNRGDNISVKINPYDDYEWALQANQSFFTIVQNALPVVSEIILKPNGTDNDAYTTDPLNLTWHYFDWDNDDEVIFQIYIIWYNKGEEQSQYENWTSIFPQNTTKGDLWNVEIQVFDGFEYSITNISFDSISISNSPPIITGVNISSNENNMSQTYSDTNLVIDLSQDINNSDPDDDDRIIWEETLLYWFKNDTYQPNFDNALIIPSSALFKGDIWYVEVQIFDGYNFSLSDQSNPILVVNKAPELVGIDLTGTQFDEFLVEDEEINLVLTLLDADQEDNDVSVITWSVDGVIQPQYNNLRYLSSNQTQAGQNWTITIYPSDGVDNGSTQIYLFYIESKPRILNFSSELDPSKEGLYKFSVLIEDELNNSITAVQYEIFLVNSSTPEIKTILSSPNGTGHWVLDYSLVDYDFINTEAIVRISATSEVEYSQTYTISRIELFNFTLIDEAAPRVINSWIILNDERNPTNITFNAEIEEFGLGIASVKVYYTFNSIEGTNETAAGIGTSIFQNGYEASMIFHEMTGNVFIYSVTVDFFHNNTDKEILYHIVTEDLEGNRNEAAWDNIRDDIPKQFIYQSPSIPQWVLLVALLAILAIFFGSVVYVRFIRKPEIVGLDKELVTKNIENISEEQISGSLDSHTIGVVVSFFDQAQGPIPIIVIPEILKDNFSKLLELSDRSFSGTGFADTFDVEIPSSYDFVLDRGVRISAMSFGLSLERPQARGGQENLTVNILIHQDVFPLVNQFQDEVKTQVHELHMLMNDPDTSGDKNLIHAKVFGLRKYISMIALAYQELYGTTDLISEDDE